MPYIFSDGEGSLHGDLRSAEAVMEQVLKAIDQYTPKMDA